MEPQDTAAACNTATSLSSAAPHTPPDTPQSARKRPLSRSGSRSSSTKSTETFSPAKKVAKHNPTATDDLSVVELTENDIGYHADVDVVYPYEVEELDSDSDRDNDDAPPSPASDAEASDAGLTRRLSRLRCGYSNEDTFERDYIRRRRVRKAGSRPYKRTHSEIVDDVDTASSDPDAVADQDLPGGQRRLRRRVVRADTEVELEIEDVSPVPPRWTGSGGEARVVSGESGLDDSAAVSWQAEDDAMDVDITR